MKFPKIYHGFNEFADPKLEIDENKDQAKFIRDLKDVAFFRKNG